MPREKLKYIRVWSNVFGEGDVCWSSHSAEHLRQIYQSRHYSAKDRKLLEWFLGEREPGNFIIIDGTLIFETNE
jgi:hypothetical protein